MSPSVRRRRTAVLRISNVSLQAADELTLTGCMIEKIYKRDGVSKFYLTTFRLVGTDKIELEGHWCKIGYPRWTLRVMVDRQCYR